MPSESLFRTTLAGSVRAELARHQISIGEAAKVAGLSRSTMARRLQDGAFTIEALAALADHLGVLVSDLLPIEANTPEAASA
jgi:transcriptional regulator with XRE-family HTH domain